jgi:hypothetical protein
LKNRFVLVVFILLFYHVYFAGQAKKQIFSKKVKIFISTFAPAALSPLSPAWTTLFFGLLFPASNSHSVNKSLIMIVFFWPAIGLFMPISLMLKIMAEENLNWTTSPAVVNETVLAAKEFLDAELAKYETWETSDKFIKGLLRF